MENNENFISDLEQNTDSENLSQSTEIPAEEFSAFSAEKGEEDIVKVIKRDKSRHSKKKKKQRKKVIKSVIWIIVIVVLSVLIAGAVIIGTGEYLGIGPGRGKEVVVEIDKGMSTKQIAERLKDADAINSAFAFRVYSKLAGMDSKYSYGVYIFNNEIGYPDLTKLLSEQGKKAESVTVRIPEMATIDEMAAILEEKGVCTKDDFINEVNYGEFDNEIVKGIPAEKLYYRFEGYLFPDTYDFYSYESKECAHLAVQKMLNKMEEVFGEENIKKANSLGYSVHEVITMASIVESESSSSPSEMGNVAAVFYNRLASPDFSRLESSPSSKYPYGNGKYDTYVCFGLPPGPICAPSLNAINGALNPTQNFDYYYFVSDAKMEFHFNKTYSAHLDTIARLKKENNWFGDR